MASNSFGTLFRITTFGESHGKAIGVVIDGCPAGLALTEADINEALALRAPGKNAYTTPRQEKRYCRNIFWCFCRANNWCTDCYYIQITMLIQANMSPSNILCGRDMLILLIHINTVCLIIAVGRASARETAARVAAGAVAKKLLAHFSIQTCAYLQTVGEIRATVNANNIAILQEATYDSPVFCPD